MARGDCDMFLTQEQAEQDGNDLFTSLATAVTVKKCKMVQKKATLKQLANSIKNIERELMSFMDKVKAMKNEQREIAHQEKLLVMNIFGCQRNRAAEESNIEDLNRKISALETEIKQTRDKLNAALLDAKETWGRFQIQYEEFPLAKKRQEVRIENTLVEIEIKKNKIKISDIIYQSKKKMEIAEKRRNAMCIELAQMYIDSRQKMAENKIKQIKLREMKQELADIIKAGKQSPHKMDTTAIPTNISPQPFSTKNKLSPPRASIWKLPQIQKPKTPPLRSSLSSISMSKFGGFDWSSLLQSSSLKSYSSSLLGKMMSTYVKPFTNESKQEQVDKKMRITSADMSKTPDAEEKQTVTKRSLTEYTSNAENIVSSQNKILKKSGLTCEEVKKIKYDAQASEIICEKENAQKKVNKNDAAWNTAEESYKKQEKNPTHEPNLHLITPSQKNIMEKTNLNDVNKSEGKQYANKLEENQTNNQKGLKFNYRSYLKANISNVTKTNTPLKDQVEQDVQSLKNESYIVETNLSSLKSGIEFTGSKSNEQSVVLQKENEVAKIKNNPPDIRMLVISPEKVNIPEIVNRHTEKSYHNSELLTGTMMPSKEQIPSNLVNNSDYEISKTENYLNLIHPSPPPDLVPVENNNQQMLQHLSQSSQELPGEPDFFSPVELDAGAKLHYQRLAAESPPPQIYQSSRQFNHNENETYIAPSGQSKYFTNTQNMPAIDEEESLNPDNDEYMPYSPPTYNGSMTSPPPGYLSPNSNSYVASPPGGNYRNHTAELKEPAAEKDTSFFNKVQTKKSNQDEEFIFGLTKPELSKPKASFFSLF